MSTNVVTHSTNTASVDASVHVETVAAAGQTPLQGTMHPLPEDALIILPVREVVLFPGAVMPLRIGRERSRAAAMEAARLQRPLGVLLQSRPEVDEPGLDDLHTVGTSANVLRYITAPDGAHHVVCQHSRVKSS